MGTIGRSKLKSFMNRKFITKHTYTTAVFGCLGNFVFWGKKTCFIYVLTFAFVCCFSWSGNTQSNLRTKTFFPSDTVQLDSLSIAFGSLKLYAKNTLIDVGKYNVDHVNARIFFTEKPDTGQMVATYRVLPIRLNATYKHKDTAMFIPKYKSPSSNFNYAYKPTTENLFGGTELNKTGSLSRGVTFGNNQDLAVNSNLSLQLNGKISDNLSILASVTDNNIPIQPDGNTQQLQDFDQVFIKVYDDKTTLTAGDYWLHKPRGYFMTYNKRAQGLLIEHKKQVTTDSSGFFRVSAGAAFSKGKFARNIIQGQEGVQGPYRLTGAENEAFIIILSGTEQVFIDGELQVRGQENDYVIDYNTSEITFTPNKMITKDRRIIVEFQYSDKNFARSLLQTGGEWKKEKWDIYLNIYSEQDAKNQPLQQELDNEHKQLLFDVGDSLQLAVISSADSIGHNPNQVLYKKIDSLGYDPVYVFSGDETNAFYSLTFSDVGQGNGFYVQDDFSALGRVFKWVAPDTVNGELILKGRFEPLAVLIAPQKRQMITSGFAFRPSENTLFFGEAALSNRDINTFSPKDSEDNTGIALKGGFKHKKELDKEKKRLVETTASLEFTGSTFNPIERFRSVEFERNWNVLGKQLSGEQLISEAGLRYKAGKKFAAGYDLSSFLSSGEYNGFMHKGNLLLKEKTISGSYSGSFLHADGAERSLFYRHKAAFKKDFRYFSIGYKDELEENYFYQNDGSLRPNSYSFYDWEIFIQNPDTFKNRYKIFYRQRIDRLSDTTKLSNIALAHHYGLSFDLIKNTNSQLRNSTSYRRLNILNNELTNQQPENTLLNRIEYNFRAYKGALSSYSFYEIGSGLELKREFAYIQVNAGQGTHTWIDYNGDGVKDINEFEVAQFADQADYIRVFTPTNEYVRTYTNQFNQTLNIRPENIWRNQSGVKKFAARFADQASYTVDRKSNSNARDIAYNPFLTSLVDSSLLSFNQTFRNSVFFNQNSTKYSLEHQYQDVRNKTLLTNGFDSRANRFNAIRLRINLGRKFTWQNKAETGVKELLSEYTQNRDFDINYYAANTTIIYQPNTKFRVSGNAKWEDKKNSAEYGAQYARVLDFGTEIRYNTPTKGTMSAGFNYILIEYTGQTNTALAFEMLNALTPGNNYTWNVFIQRNLSKSLQINLNYVGRKSEETPVIHTGGVQVRAMF